MAQILVVEDDPLIRELVRTVLDRSGHHLLEAASVAVAHKLLDDRPVDLVLSDLGLPDGDGDEIIRRVLEEGTAKVIAMTGRARTTQLPVHASLRKPIPLGELVALVDQLAGDRKSRAAQPEQRHEPVALLNERMTALAGVSEALARAVPGELPLRPVLQRYLDAPGVEMVALYRHGAGGVPELVVAALTEPVPHGEVAGFWGRSDLLSAADVTDDILVDLSAEEGPIGELLESAGMGRIVVAPLVFARRGIGLIALGFGTRAESPPVAFVKTVQSQLTLLWRLAETLEDAGVQLVGPDSTVEHFKA